MLAVLTRYHYNHSADFYVTTSVIFQHLATCGTHADDLALFERLLANGTFQPAGAISLFDQLSANVIEIPSDAYKSRSVHQALRLTDTAYDKRLKSLIAQSIDLTESDYKNVFEGLLPTIERYVEHPSEITARRLYQAFDFDLIISAHHAVEDIYAEMLLNILRTHKVDSHGFHAFALFACLTSVNPHVVQNFLFALGATSGPVPHALLNVLGRYEPFNLPSYALIDRVPGLNDDAKHDLAFTLLKSMDEAFYFKKLEAIDMSGDASMSYWAALNTSTETSILYFCEHLMAETVRDDHLLAALDHYIWCVSRLVKSGDEYTLDGGEILRSLEEKLWQYLKKYMHCVSDSDEAASLIRWRYRRLAILNAEYNYSAASQKRRQAITSMLDAIAQVYAQPRFDDMVAALARDLADQSSGYSNLLRPAGHRYDLLIQAKIAAAQRWFPRELSRVQAHDFANWGTLTLVLQTGVQFNALCNWLLKEMARDALPSDVLDALVYEALLHYPANSDMLLQARHFFVKALASQNGKWVPRALSALHKHVSSGHPLPSELIAPLRALDTAEFKRLHLHFLDRLLG